MHTCLHPHPEISQNSWRTSEYPPIISKEFIKLLMGRTADIVSRKETNIGTYYQLFKDTFAFT